TPLWRKHALLGLLLACSGVVGLWGIGFYTPDLIRSVQLPRITEKTYQAEIASAEGERAESLTRIYSAIQSREVNTLAAADKELHATMEKRVSSELAWFTSLTSIAIN